jgi:hypothetical protein
MMLLPQNCVHLTSILIQFLCVRRKTEHAPSIYIIILHMCILVFDWMRSAIFSHTLYASNKIENVIITRNIDYYKRQKLLLNFSIAILQT